MDKYTIKFNEKTAKWESEFKIGKHEIDLVPTAIAALVEHALAYHVGRGKVDKETVIDFLETIIDEVREYED